MSEHYRQAGAQDIAGLIEAAKAMMAAAQASMFAVDRLLQSVEMLTDSVGQLLGEEMGQPVADEPKAEPLPENLDID